MPVNEQRSQQHELLMTPSKLRDVEGNNKRMNTKIRIKKLEIELLFMFNVLSLAFSDSKSQQVGLIVWI